MNRSILVSAVLAATALPMAAATAQSAPAGNQAQAQPAPRQYNLSGAERTAMAPLFQAIDHQDWAAAQAAFPAAQAAAQGADAKYLLGQAQLRIGIGTNNNQLQGQAVDMMIDSGGAHAEELPRLLGFRADFAIQNHDYDKADQALTRLSQLTPNDIDLTIRRAQLRAARNDLPGALELYDQAIQARQAAGQPVDENLRKRALAAAYQAHQGPRSIALSRDLVTAYPSASNWRDALVVYKEFTNPEAGVLLDLRRLQRAAHALAGEGDYVAFADTLARAGLPGEAKAVLDEGVSRGSIQAASANVAPLLGQVNGQVAQDRAGLAAQRTEAMAAADGRRARATGDAYYGYGQYAEAADLYRAALRKGGEDAGMVNLRLGAALALAGQREPAEAAFHAVTGSRADLANYWLLLLAHPAQGEVQVPPRAQ